jgi:hypothetical protein
MIRYKCDSCGSSLNIKDELAGTQGKCPKCKTPFTVPSPPAQEHAAPPPPAAPPASRTAEAPAPKRPARVASSPAAAGGDDAEFDPVAFLMDDDGPRTRGRAKGKTVDRHPVPAPQSDDEIPEHLSLDEDDPPAPPKSKKAARRRIEIDSDEELEAYSLERPAMGSASETAGKMLAGGASSGAAKDLLTRTMEESRARSARVEDEQPAPPPAWLELTREFGVRGLLGLAGVLLVAVGVYLIMYRMLGSGVPLPKLARVSGTVTLDGQPLAGAQVRFTLLSEDGRNEATEVESTSGKTVRVRPGMAITDEDGRYSLEYMEGLRGTPVGKNRVSLSKLGDGGRELVPGQYGPLSVETRDVESGSQTIDFALTSDAPRRGQGPPGGGGGGGGERRPN